MKNFKLSLLAVMLLGAAACTKNNGALPSSGSPTINGSITTDDAASLAAGAVSVPSNGIAYMSADATLSATNIGHLPDACGTIKSDSISRQSTSGSAFAYSYKLLYKFVVDCNSSSVPDSLSSSLTYSGSFSGPNISSTNSGSSIFTVNGLLPTDTAFVINGEFKRAGSFASKVDTSKHGSNNIDIVISGLTVKRPSRVIESGNATISITGSTPKNGSFSFTGTLVFNGDGTATLTLNGKLYTINLFNGGCQRRGW